MNFEHRPNEENVRKQDGCSSIQLSRVQTCIRAFVEIPIPSGYS